MYYLRHVTLSVSSAYHRNLLYIPNNHGSQTKANVNVKYTHTVSTVVICVLGYTQMVTAVCVWCITQICQVCFIASTINKRTRNGNTLNYIHNFFFLLFSCFENYINPVAFGTHSALRNLFRNTTNIMRSSPHEHPYHRIYPYVVFVIKSKAWQNINQIAFYNSV